MYFKNFDFLFGSFFYYFGIFGFIELSTFVFLLLCDVFVQLQVTRSLANKIETYACPPCISKDSDLHIVYRTSVIFITVI